MIDDIKNKNNFGEMLSAFIEPPSTHIKIKSRASGEKNLLTLVLESYIFSTMKDFNKLIFEKLSTDHLNLSLSFLLGYFFKRTRFFL